LVGYCAPFTSCVRSMCCIAVVHTTKYIITSKSYFERPGGDFFDSYVVQPPLATVARWAGHVARMPMDRMPRKLLAGLVERARPVSSPQMT
jgi:hypothetical protein